MRWLDSANWNCVVVVGDAWEPAWYAVIGPANHPVHTATSRELRWNCRPVWQSGMIGRVCLSRQASLGLGVPQRAAKRNPGVKKLGTGGLSLSVCRVLSPCRGGEKVVRQLSQGQSQRANQDFSLGW